MADNKLDAKSQIILELILMSIKNLHKLFSGIMNGKIDPNTIDLNELRDRQKAIIRPPVKK
jgi:hypothetical protein